MERPPEYLAKREELRLAEIELMRQRERVAELRRHLPQGTPIQDYRFAEGPGDLNGGDTPVRTVRLSELFTKPNRSLIIYHLMYGKRQTKACPMCTAWLDGANGVAHHLAQNLDFAVVAAADVATLRAHARTRGWDKLRLLSAGNSTFKYDLGSGHSRMRTVEMAQGAVGVTGENGNGGVLMPFAVLVILPGLDLGAVIEAGVPVTAARLPGLGDHFRIAASLDRKRRGADFWGGAGISIRGVFDKEARRKPLALAANAGYAVGYGI